MVYLALMSIHLSGRRMETCQLATVASDALPRLPLSMWTPLLDPASRGLMSLGWTHGGGGGGGSSGALCRVTSRHVTSLFRLARLVEETSQRHKEGEERQSQGGGGKGKAKSRRLAAEGT